MSPEDDRDGARAEITEESTDVAVVGAGLSGLVAARALDGAGVETLVLEARDRVGGRTWSRRIGRGTFDLGGQWLGPTQQRMRRLCEELGIATFPTFSTGRKVMFHRGAVSTYAGLIPSLPLHDLLTIQRAIGKLERMASEVPLEAPERAPRAAEWDASTVESWRRRQLPFRGGQGAFDAAIRVVFGADPAELSLLHFLFYLRSGGGFEALASIEGGAQQTRFVDGAQVVSRKLAATLPERIRLEFPVCEIEQTARGVLVRGGGGPSHPRRLVRARRVILAVPPVLAGRIAYTPSLPASRDQLTQRVPMGATVKAMALYDRPFWRERGLSGEAVATVGARGEGADRTPVAVAFDNTSHDGAQPALLAFIVGAPARTWSERDPAERRRLVLEAFTRFFGAEAADPTGYHEQDWSTERWSAGCPVGNPTPGTLTRLGPALRRPVGAIHFAGTETASEWNGYMEGAAQAGERAAAEVIASLSGSR